MLERRGDTRKASRQILKDVRRFARVIPNRMKSGRCPFVAHDVNRRGAAPCRQLEADRKWLAQLKTVAFDPERTSRLCW
jgi:hypothetical protein